MRKMISFKLENLPDKQRRIVDEWADSQSNIQQSLTNLVMHVVAYAGNDDVMDFDTQRKLHTLFAMGGVEAKTQQVNAAPPVQVQPVKAVENTEKNIYNATDWD